ncbi:MAG: putative Ig domain-containing protein [bacterium]|nr:putative Ig domain-containing protein [bacterium]
MKVNSKLKSQKSKLQLKSQNFWDLGFGIWDFQPRAGFTLIELIVSVALLLVALSIALFAVVGTNGMIQKADARSSISESTRGVGEAIRRTVANAPVGAVTPIITNDDGTTFAAIQVKAFSNLQSGNTCTVIGRAIATTDSTGEEKYTIDKDGAVIAILIYNVDSGGLCPLLTTSPIYQNRLTNVQAVVKDAKFAVQSVACTTITTSCVTKQLLRYSLTLEAAQKGSGGTSEARKPTLTIQEGLPIGLVNEATVVLKIETTTLPDANARGQYTASVVASGGMPPYQNWSILTGSYWTPSDPGGQGFSINQNTGVITSGSLNSQAAGRTYHFTVKVFDSANPSISTTRDLSITVLDNLITITTTQAQFDSNPAQENSSYNQQLTATMKLNPSNCGSCIWSIPPNSLPSGLSLDSNNGKISGKPDPGTATNSPYTLVITATESGAPTNYTTKTFSLTVQPSGGGGPPPGPDI